MGGFTVAMVLERIVSRYRIVFTVWKATVFCLNYTFVNPSSTSDGAAFATMITPPYLWKHDYMFGLEITYFVMQKQVNLAHISICNKAWDLCRYPSS